MPNAIVCCGIDPGLTGAVVFIKGNEIVDCFDAPVEVVMKGKKRRTELLPYSMSSIIESRSLDSSHFFIESVHSMPGQGLSSTFQFGKGYGMWLGILAALQAQHTTVTPQAWKKAVMQGLPDKDASRGRAQQLFPSQAGLFVRKKDVGRADAALIAWYGKTYLLKGR